MELKGDTDADCGGDINNIRSTSECVFCSIMAPYHRVNEKQSCVALSMMGIEFVPLSSVA